MPDETNAGSSSAVVEPVESVAAPDAQTTIDQFSPTERNEWLKTGKTPEPSTAADSATADPKTPVNAPESGPGKGLGRRQEQLTAEVAQLKETLRLRAELRAELARLEGERTPKPTEKTGEPSKRPQIKDFETWEQYEEAVAAFNEQQALSIAEKRFSELSAADRQRAQQESAMSNARAAYAKAEADAEAAYPDYKEVIQHLEMDPLPEGSVAVQDFVVNGGSELLPHMVRYFALNRTEYERINGLPTLAAQRELVALEAKIKGEISLVRGQPNGSKRVSATAAPPRTVAGHQVTAGDDEAEQAVAAGDFEKFRRVMDKRERDERGRFA